MYTDAGWGEYPNGQNAMGRVYQQMAGLAYTPDLGPVGSGAAGTYYPRDTSDDAAALNFLGFYPDQLLAAHIGTQGDQPSSVRKRDASPVMTGTSVGRSRAGSLTILTGVRARPTM